MSKTNSNKILGYVFAALLVVILFMFVFDGGKNERTFRDVLVDIDTAEVDNITIITKEKDEVNLFKKDDEWFVKVNENKNASVPASKIKNMFDQLLQIKPKRLAARSQNKWEEFQVDSSGIRVIVKDGGSTELDLVVGKFAFQQPRSMSSFVRLFNDKDVYEVDGFLQMSFNQGVNAYRNGKIIEKDFGEWTKVSYEYPADSSFEITKMNDKWLSVNGNIDSAKTVNFLRQLQNKSTTEFIDDVEPETLTNHDYSLVVETESGENVEIKAYKNEGRFLITSSDNPGSVFDGSKNDFGNNVFVGISKFIK
ncbi:MAG: DUF4340 domain-containing protein [Ignavibacteria bacterium]|jgi:hypothetical protein